MAALNSQTAIQFQQYAAQQYPGNYEQQQILIRQLQEQHYQQYMQQLYQVQLAQQQVRPTAEKLRFCVPGCLWEMLTCLPLSPWKANCYKERECLVTHAASDSNTKAPLFNLFE